MWAEPESPAVASGATTAGDASATTVASSGSAPGGPPADVGPASASTPAPVPASCQSRYAPHDTQKASAPTFSVPHFWQTIAPPSCDEAVPVYPEERSEPRPLRAGSWPDVSARVCSTEWSGISVQPNGSARACGRMGICRRSAPVRCEPTASPRPGATQSRDPTAPQSNRTCGERTSRRIEFGWVAVRAPGGPRVRSHLWRSTLMVASPLERRPSPCLVAPCDARGAPNQR